jgi:hypothetical protein
VLIFPKVINIFYVSAIIGGEGEGPPKNMLFFIQQLLKLTIIDDKLYQSSTNLLPPLQGEGWGGVI